MICSSRFVSLWRRLAAVAVLSSGREHSSSRSLLRWSHKDQHRNWVSCFVLGTTGGMEELVDRNENTPKRSCPSPTNDMDLQHPHLSIFRYGGDGDTIVDSTQDECRRLLQRLSPSLNGPYLVVLADRQKNGRGTHGRKWEGGQQKGNLFLTIAIPLDKIPVMPTLLPLQIAVLVAERTAEAIRACCDAQQLTSRQTVEVKWPNDVLVNDQKLSGTLIESEIVNGHIWLLVGIGVNILYAPSLVSSPGKHVRGATCIRDHCVSTTELDKVDLAFQFGTDVAQRLVDWLLEKGDTTKSLQEARVVQNWKAWAKFGKCYELRGTVERESAGLHQGEQVIVLDIQQDGQLLVRGQNGQERLLVADYLF